MRGKRLVALLAVASLWAGLHVAPAAGNAGAVTLQPGLYAGSVVQLAISPHDPSLVIAVTKAGFFRSRDGGATWHTIGSELSEPRPGVAFSASQVVYDPNDPAVLYGFLGEATGNSHLYRSLDSGDTWQPLGTLPDVGISELAVSAVHPGRMYASTGWEVFRSDDSGTSWRELHGPWYSQLAGMTLSPVDDRLYVSDGDLYSSTDGGETWDENEAGGSPEADPRDADVVYMFGARRVFRSEDRGESFSMLCCEYNEDTLVRSIERGAGDTLYISGYYGDGFFVARSDDLGQTWHEPTRFPGGFHSWNALAADPVDPMKVLVGGDYDGIRSSNDGGATLEYSNTGLTAQAATVVITDPNDASVLYTVLMGGEVFKSIDAGLSWARLTHALRWSDKPYRSVWVPSMAVDQAGDLMAMRNSNSGPPEGQVVHSTDGGQTWTAVLQPPGESVYAKHVAADPTRPGTFIAAFTFYDSPNYTGRLYRTSDGGATWSEFGQVVGEPLAFEVHPVSGTIYLLYIDRDLETPAYKLLRGESFGERWETHQLPSIIRYAATLGLDPVADRVYAADNSSGAVGRSEDGGKTWVATGRCAVGCDDRDEVTDISVDPVDRTQVLLGRTRTGLWISRDLGETWRQSGAAGAPVNEPVHDVEFVPPADAEDAQVLQFRPAFIGSGNNHRSGLSRLVPRPHNRTRPTASGVARVGRRLACVTGRWSRASRYSYKWLRQGKPIAGATGAKYLLVRADRSRRVACRITARGPGGTDHARSPGRYVRQRA